METTTNDQLLSAHQIAKNIKRSHPCVLDIIKKLDIKPHTQIGSRKYYTPSTADTISKSMRNPNKK